MKLVALTTCHNRRELTLRCLEKLQSQYLARGDQLKIVVVDDGSVDGTASTIHARFPKIDIVNGNGTLYWAGGMRHGWSYVSSRYELDALVVFNDDTSIREDAIYELVSSSKALTRRGFAEHIIAGAFHLPNTTKLSYGGYLLDRRFGPLRLKATTPNGLLQEIDTLNMNLALISANALNKIGFLAPYYRHSGADIEYGHRARKSGIKQYLLPTWIGECSINPEKGTYMEDNITRFERVRRYSSVKGQPFLERLRFCFDHGGMLWPLLLFYPYVKIILFNRVKRHRT